MPSAVPLCLGDGAYPACDVVRDRCLDGPAIHVERYHLVKPAHLPAGSCLAGLPSRDAWRMDGDNRMPGLDRICPPSQNTVVIARNPFSARSAGYGHWRFCDARRRDQHRPRRRLVEPLRTRSPGDWFVHGHVGHNIDFDGPNSGSEAAKSK